MFCRGLINTIENTDQREKCKIYLFLSVDYYICNKKALQGPFINYVGGVSLSTEEIQQKYIDFSKLITLEDIEHFRHIKIILGQPFFVIFLELTEDGTKSDFKAMYNYARQWKLVLFYRSLEYTLILFHLPLIQGI